MSNRVSVRFIDRFMQNIVAAIKLFKKGKKGCCSQMLLAQMQSGKQITFLLVAALFILEKLVEHVVIFTGNRELELKEQIMFDLNTNIDDNDENRIPIFARGGIIFNIMIEIKILTHDNAEDKLRDVRSRIICIWGADLKKKCKHTTNTLFIHEESHYAQSNNQQPDKFLKKIGVNPNGSIEQLKKKNNYLLSVDATPFSELSDNIHLKQGKNVVILEPSEGYKGVNHFLENNKIKGYDSNNMLETINDAISRNNDIDNDNYKYGILRLHKHSDSDSNNEEIKQICSQNGWIIKHYDGIIKEIQNFKSLINKPQQNTLIIIKGLGRMGSAYSKKHIKFMMETAKDSNTDTILQCFRACGYDTPDDLMIYINNKILSSGQLQDYVALMSGNFTQIPDKAKNIIQNKKSSKKKTKTSVPIIPILISKNNTTNNTKDKILLKEILNDVINTDDPNKNLNPPEITKLLKEQFCNNDSIQIEIKKLSKKSYRHVPSKIIETINTREPNRLGSSASCKDERAIIWCVDTPIMGMELGSWYLCFEIKPINKINYKTIPKTNGKEIFRGYQIESGENIIANGGYNISLKQETSIDETLMLNTIRECIYRSNDTETYLEPMRKIVSNFSINNTEWNGIYVSDQIFISIKLGYIYNKIFEEFGLHLNIIKPRGRPSKYMPMGCDHRLAEISW
jgi:hypothetical protein